MTSSRWHGIIHDHYTPYIFNRDASKHHIICRIERGTRWWRFHAATIDSFDAIDSWSWKIMKFAKIWPLTCHNWVKYWPRTKNNTTNHEYSARAICWSHQGGGVAPTGYYTEHIRLTTPAKVANHCLRPRVNNLLPLYYVPIRFQRWILEKLTPLTHLIFYHSQDIRFHRGKETPSGTGVNNFSEGLQYRRRRRSRRSRYMFLVTGDAGTYYPEPESEPGYFSRDGARAIKHFAASAFLPLTRRILHKHGKMTLRDLPSIIPISPVIMSIFRLEQ